MTDVDKDNDAAVKRDGPASRYNNQVTVITPRDAVVATIKRFTPFNEGNVGTPKINGGLLGEFATGIVAPVSTLIIIISG